LASIVGERRDRFVAVGSTDPRIVVDAVEEVV